MAFALEKRLRESLSFAPLEDVDDCLFGLTDELKKERIIQ